MKICNSAAHCLLSFDEKKKKNDRDRGENTARTSLLQDQDQCCRLRKRRDRRVRREKGQQQGSEEVRSVSHTVKQGFSRRIRIVVVWSCEASILQDVVIADIAINIDIYTMYTLLTYIRTYNNVKGKKCKKKKKKKKQKIRETYANLVYQSLSLSPPSPSSDANSSQIESFYHWRHVLYTSQRPTKRRKIIKRNERTRSNLFPNSECVIRYVHWELRWRTHVVI